MYLKSNVTEQGKGLSHRTGLRFDPESEGLIVQSLSNSPMGAAVGDVQIAVCGDDFVADVSKTNIDVGGILDGTFKNISSKAKSN